MHESKTHRYNSFLTLTYDDQHLPQHGSLRYKDFQDFNKRLITAAFRGGMEGTIAFSPTVNDERSYAASRHGRTSNIRFYMAGEYGSQLGRPHYHACMFGVDFRDKSYLGRTPSGSKLWRSATLEKLWPHGFSSVGEVTFESAAYVARYVMKKITGTKAKKHYEKIDPTTGEIIELTPEFNQMSRATGIGKTWLKRFEADVYPHAKVIVRGHKTNPPRAYDKWYRAEHPIQWEAIEYDRFLAGQANHQEQLPHRLKARETVTAAKISQLKRKL